MPDTITVTIPRPEQIFGWDFDMISGSANPAIVIQFENWDDMRSAKEAFVAVRRPRKPPYHWLGAEAEG